jgi:hypothetical protein
MTATVPPPPAQTQPEAAEPPKRKPSKLRRLARVAVDLAIGAAVAETLDG